jgi:hypothetical protein
MDDEAPLRAKPKPAKPKHTKTRGEWVDEGNPKQRRKEKQKKWKPE